MHIDFNVGEVVPGTHYRVVHRIGQGGMGSVYEVEHVELGKRFVLKALLPQFLERKDLVQRLRNEWRSLGKLEHANIVSVSDAGVAKNGVPFYVMERLQGETLAAALKTRGRLSLPEALRVACEILEGLSAAHEIGVVHRDVKPPNIFLTQGGVAKVLDFGIAKLTDGASLELTGRGIAIGTPRYMSPEQAAGETVDGRADVYAVGLLLFEMVAGVGPFDGGDANEVFLAHLTRVPPRLASVAPGIPVELDALVAALLAKHPSERPATAGAAARALRGILRGYPQPRAESSIGPVVRGLTPVMMQGPGDVGAESLRMQRSLAPSTIYPPAPESQRPSARPGQRIPLAEIAPRRTPPPVGYPADLTTQSMADAAQQRDVPSLSQLAAFAQASPGRAVMPTASTPPPSSISRPPAWGSASLPAPARGPSRTRLVAFSALAVGLVIGGGFWIGKDAVEPEAVASLPNGEVLAAVAAQAVPAALPVAQAEPGLVAAVGNVDPSTAALAARSQRLARKIRASSDAAATERSLPGSIAGDSQATHSIGVSSRGLSERGSSDRSLSEAPSDKDPAPNRASSPSRGFENGGRRLPDPGIPLYRMQPRGR